MSSPSHEREMRLKDEAFDQMLATLKALRLMMRESRGVAGFHANGDVMEWDRWEDLNPEMLEKIIAFAEGGEVLKKD